MNSSAANDQYSVSGTIIAETSLKPLANVSVIVMDRDMLSKDDVLGQATTNTNGEFAVTFDRSAFSAGFWDTKPDLYFKVMQGEHEIYNDREGHLANAGNHTKDIVIRVRTAN